jgi:hypothetical protein
MENGLDLKDSAFRMVYGQEAGLAPVLSSLYDASYASTLH